MTKNKTRRAPKTLGETAYRATVRAHACDVLRSYLPAATLTENVGIFGVAGFEYLLSKMYSHELSEAKELATAMHGELNQRIPSFVKRAQMQRLSGQHRRVGEKLWRPMRRKRLWPAANESVMLIDYDLLMQRRKSSRRFFIRTLFIHCSSSP